MAESIGTRLKHAWNAFTTKSTNPFQYSTDYGASYGSRPDRLKLNLSNERSIIASAYTRLGIDVAALQIRHVRVNEDGEYQETFKSGLNNCLSVEANLDQSAQAFIQDAAMTLFDQGVIAIVPVDTTLDPTVTGGYDISSLRVGTIREWFPRHVRVYVYNDKTGRKEELILPKNNVAIIENPFYSVMNEPNSTLKRLVRKLNILDMIDEQSGSGKLDLIIQLPYVVKSEAREAQAEKRRKNIEMQLHGSKYGIAYTDATEKVTQLNRPAENNLASSIKDLTDMLYSQLGISPEVLAGTADQQNMINYHNRAVKPVVTAIIDGMRRVFLTKTARSQGQTIMYFRDPFANVAVNEFADVADKFTRNEILSSNNVRSYLGIKPVNTPEANSLRNKNLNPADPQQPQAPDTTDQPAQAT